MKPAAALYTQGEYLSRNPTWHEEDGPQKAAEVAEILSRAGVQPGRIADVGCGSGAALKALRRYFPGAEFAGYDLAPRAIEMAGSSSANGTRFSLGSPPPDSADVAMALDVIEHTEDPFAFVRELRNTAPRVLLRVPLEFNAANALLRLYMKTRRMYGHITYFSATTLLATLEEAGLEVEAVSYVCAYAPRPARPKQWVLWLPSLLFLRVAPALGSHLLPGFTILVLAKRRQAKASDPSTTQDLNP